MAIMTPMAIDDFFFLPTWSWHEALRLEKKLQCNAAVTRDIDVIQYNISSLFAVLSHMSFAAG